MNTILLILSAVVNSLWQALAVAVLVWLALRFMPRINAATRYAIWWATLGVVLILPVAPRLILMMRPHPQSAAVTAVKTSITAAPIVTVEPVVVTVTPGGRTGKWPIAILAIWAAILLWRLGQIVRSYFYLRGVKRRSSISPIPLPAIPRHADLLISPDIVSPMAVGFLRPAIVLPESLLEELSEPEREHVLLHESAHLAKYDDWSNLAMRLLAGALALHPVAIWILWRIEREREMACDDWVVARTGAARPYAASLAHLFELRRARRDEMLASGLFGSRSRLGDRIEMLLGRGRTFSPRASAGGIAASTVVLSGFMLAASFAPRWIAFAQQPVRPSFEVTSVKPVSRDKLTGPGRLRYSPQGVDFSNVPLSWVIGEAYGVAYNRVSGSDQRIRDMFFAPEGTAYFFDIAAKADHPVPKAQIRLMLQTLLADRFALRAHREPRVQLVYKLTIGKSGPKLPEAAAGGEPACSFGLDGLVCRNVEMTRFSGMLSTLMDRPVLDSTGLTGSYDFTLKFQGSQEGKAAIVEWLSSSVFGDIEKQLGLRLEQDKGPVEYLIVDHAEKPDAN
jgi:uncharacterized protein (TIGR03435 family)